MYGLANPLSQPEHWNILAVSKHVVGGIPLVLVDFRADVVCWYRIVWVAGSDLAHQLKRLLIDFIATLLFAFERGA